MSCPDIFLPALEASSCPLYDMETQKTAKKRDFTDSYHIQQGEGGTIKYWDMNKVIVLVIDKSVITGEWRLQMCASPITLGNPAISWNALTVY